METQFWRLIKFLVVLFAVGCMNAPQHRQDVRDETGNQLTVGTVQKEIKVGMPASAVAEILGSPNVVTTDENRREVWIYDKISTERVYSETRGGASILILGSGGSAGAATTSQRTLTVIIKFDDKNLVRDFAYRTSRF